MFDRSCDRLQPGHYPGSIAYATTSWSGSPPQSHLRSTVAEPCRLRDQTALEHGHLPVSAVSTRVDTVIIMVGMAMHTMTRSEASKILGLSKGSIRRFERERKLAVVRVGNVVYLDPEQVNALAAQRHAGRWSAPVSPVMYAWPTVPVVADPPPSSPSWPVAAPASAPWVPASSWSAPYDWHVAAADTVAAEVHSGLLSLGWNEQVVYVGAAAAWHAVMSLVDVSDAMQVRSTAWSAAWSALSIWWSTASW